MQTLVPTLLPAKSPEQVLQGKVTEITADDEAIHGFCAVYEQKKETALIVAEFEVESQSSAPPSVPEGDPTADTGPADLEERQLSIISPPASKTSILSTIRGDTEQAPPLETQNVKAEPYSAQPRTGPDTKIQVGTMPSMPRHVPTHTEVALTLGPSQTDLKTAKSLTPPPANMTSIVSTTSDSNSRFIEAKPGVLQQSTEVKNIANLITEHKVDRSKKSAEVRTQLPTATQPTAASTLALTAGVQDLGGARRAPVGPTVSDEKLGNSPEMRTQIAVVTPAATPRPKDPNHPLQNALLTQMQGLGTSGIASQMLAAQADEVQMGEAELADLAPHDSRLPAIARLGVQAVRPDTTIHVVRQISEVLRANVTGERRIELSLNPAELGKLRMTLSPSETGMAVSIVADRSETLDLIRRNIEDLAKTFSDMGYEDISFNFDQGTEFTEGADDSSEHETQSVKSLDFEDATPQQDIPPPLQRSRLTDSGVDVRV